MCLLRLRKPAAHLVLFMPVSRADDKVSRGNIIGKNELKETETEVSVA